MSAAAREIDKEQAVPYLLHSAIRLIMEGEDPFAIHMLAQSADKLLVDLAKARGEYLKVDWELYIKDEYQAEFFKKHREIYNFFKHADRDFDNALPVKDIIMLNVMT